MRKQGSNAPGCNRREFLGSSAKNAAGVAAGMVTFGHRPPGPAEKVRVAVVGVRNQGRKLAHAFSKLPHSGVAALADIDQAILATTAKTVADEQGQAPDLVSDWRRLLDRPDIDAIVVATPNHWHATMAREILSAGKHLYLEVPVARTLEETQTLQDWARDAQVVIQTGLQQRSCSHIQSAMHWIRSGRLGRITMARAWTSHRRKPLPAVADRSCPEGVDYSAWLGPAATVSSFSGAAAEAFNPNRFHFHWRWFWDFGGGELEDWGVHLLDTVAWGLQLGWPNQVSASGLLTTPHSPQQTPDTLSVQYVFDDCVVTWEHRQWCNYGSEGRSSAAAFYGEKGLLVVDRGGWKVYHHADKAGGDGSCQLADHCADFIRAIRESRAPAAGLSAGMLASQLALLGNLSYRRQQTLHCDAERRQVPDSRTSPEPA